MTQPHVAKVETHLPSSGNPGRVTDCPAVSTVKISADSVTLSPTGSETCHDQGCGQAVTGQDKAENLLEERTECKKDDTSSTLEQTHEDGMTQVVRVKLEGAEAPSIAESEGKY